MSTRLTSTQMSSRHLLPGSIAPLAPGLAARWIPGTSPGMTSIGMQKLIGISLVGNVGRGRAFRGSNPTLAR